MNPPQTVASLLSRCLRAAGVTRAFAAPGHGIPVLAGISVVQVPSVEIAVALADADGRLAVAPSARPGLALLPGGRLRLSSQPGEVVPAVPIAIEDLPAAIAGWSLGRVHSAFEIELAVDLGAEVAEDLQPLVVQRGDQLVRLSPSLADLRTMIVVGPGVVRDGVAGDVADAATRMGAGVMVTMGAIGAVPFDHPAYCGVVGVQFADPALGGLDASELVIAVGIDPDELGESVPVDAQVLEVEPWHLAFLATDWPAPVDDAAIPSELVDGLGDVLGAHRSDGSMPLSPVRATIDVLDSIGPTDHVFVDPGPAGVWFARGVVPVAAGRVVVPALPVEGFSVAAAIITALDGGRSIAITTPGSALVASLCDLAAALDLDIVVELWGDDATLVDPAQHRASIVAAQLGGGVNVTGVAVDLPALADLVELAGPFVAWMPID